MNFSGQLLKKTAIVKKWKPAFYEIRDNSIVEVDQDKGKVKNTILLGINSIIEPITKDPKRFIFKVTSSNKKSFEFDAQSTENRAKWINELIKVRPAPEGALKRAVPQKVGPEDFEILRVLGRGTYGKVSLVREKATGELFAMKSMSKAVLAEDGNINQILTEKNVLIRNQHPFLVSAKYSFQSEAKLFMVMDYVPGGEMFGRLQEERRIAERRAKLYCAEIVLALEHLHNLNFIYRDLKPENILIDTDGHLKLTDFGYTKKLESQTDSTSSFCGTPDYLAPEVIGEDSYTKAVDWWGLGVVLYEMLAGISPFYNENTKKMYRAILNSPVTYPPYFSFEVKDFIGRLLDKTPDTRLGSGPGDAEEVKSHKWFSSINWDDVYNKKIAPEWKPHLKECTDTSLFDDQFTQEEPCISFEDPNLIPASAQDKFEGFTYNNNNETPLANAQ